MNDTTKEHRPESKVTRGELGIVLSIILGTITVTATALSVRASDTQRLTRLESIVENQSEQLKLLRDNTEAVRRLFEIHLNDSLKPKD